MPNLKSHQRPYLGSVMYAVQLVSITPYSLKALSLKMAPVVGMVGNGIPKDREGVEEPPSA